MVDVSPLQLLLSLYYYISLRFHTKERMAFDRPLDADRVDNLGLLSSFLRAPIVGPIMWILGGDMAQKQEDEERRKATRTALGTSDASRDESSEDRRKPISDQSKIQYESSTNASGILYSDMAETSDCAQEFESNDDGLQIATTGLRKSRQLFDKKTRKTSWSDESGQSLAQYYDEVSLNRLCFSLSPAASSGGCGDWISFVCYYYRT